MPRSPEIHEPDHSIQLGARWKPGLRNTFPRSRPFVYLNCALSADGKLSASSRHFEPFGSRLDERLLYELRAHADAILCGARTLDSNPATMGNGGTHFTSLRRKRGLAPHPLRVIVSGRGSIDPGAAIFQHRFSPIVVLACEIAPKRRLARLRALADKVAVFGQREVDFPRALRWLRKHWGVNCLICEGGGELNAALIQAGLVDELFLTVCPLIIGGRKAPTLADGVGVDRLEKAAQFQLVRRHQAGSEMFLHYSSRK